MNTEMNENHHQKPTKDDTKNTSKFPKVTNNYTQWTNSEEDGNGDE